MIGLILADSGEEGLGAYQQADLHFLQDLAHGAAARDVDLLAAYSQAPQPRRTARGLIRRLEAEREGAKTPLTPRLRTCR